jgi:hypothetical protein
MNLTHTKPYTPRPGSVAQRALTWLQYQPAGTEVGSMALAAELDVRAEVLPPALRPALASGLLNCRNQGRNTLWSLPKPGAAAAAATAVPGAGGGGRITLARRHRGSLELSIADQTLLVTTPRETRYLARFLGGMDYAKEADRFSQAVWCPKAQQWRTPEGRAVRLGVAP